MQLTLLLSLVLILALILLVYATVALIQDNRLYKTAPKDIQAAAIDHPERFPGAHLMGWILAIIALAMMIGAFIYGGYDGIKKCFGFWQFFTRFLVMLYIWKAFDIIGLDWYLMTRSHFFQKYYPETEGCEGYRDFGFNRREQLFRIIIFPFVSALLAYICTLIV